MRAELTPRLPLFGIGDAAGTGALLADIDGTECFLLFSTLELAELYQEEAGDCKIWRIDTAAELRAFTNGCREASQAAYNPTFRSASRAVVEVPELIAALEDDS